MKKLLVIVVLACVAVTTSFAQESHSEENDKTVKTSESGVAPGMKYNQLKKIYNYKDYTKGLVVDHSPVGIGVASCLIPGLGEMICGEGWRGAGFLVGWLASHVITLVGIGELSDAIYWTGIAGAWAMRAASTVDAIRVAKVKNMYKCDLMGKSALYLDIYPSVNYVHTAAHGIQPTAGLTLSMQF